MAKSKKVVASHAWTRATFGRSRQWLKENQASPKIAKKLRRTPGATSVMAAKLGVSLSMCA